MNHTEFEELLSAYANDELARTQREFVEEHLSGCPECRAQLTEFAWVRSTVSLLATVPAESDIKERTMASIRAIGPQQAGVYSAHVRGDFWARLGLYRLLRPALVMAAIAAVVIIPLVLQLSGAGTGGLIAKAYAATAALQSYRMSGTTAQVFKGVASETTFEYEFAAPDRYHVSMVADGELQEFIIIGDRQYTRVSGGQPSRNVVEIVIDGGFNVYNPIPSGEGTLQLLDSLTDLKELSEEEIDGVETLHYQGRVDVDRIMDEQAAALDPQSPVYRETVEFLDLQRSIRIDVELWISKEDYTIQQMKLDGQSPTTGSGGKQIGSSSHSTMVRYFDLNAPIEIEPPLTASGELVPGWNLVGSGPPAPQIQGEVKSEGQ